MKKIMSLMLTLMVCFTSLVGCSTTTGKESTDGLTKVKVSEFRSLGWYPVYVAYEKGYFKEEGLDIEFVKYNDGPVAFQGMHAGDSDFCLLSQEPVLRAQEEGMKSALVGKVQDTRGYVLVTGKDYKKVSDLKGKTIFAGQPGSAPYSFVSKILEENGIDPQKDVTFANLDYGSSVAALEKGDIAATYISAFNKANIKNQDVNYLVDTTNEKDSKKYLNTTDFPGEIIATTKEFADKNSDTVKKFMTAVQKAAKWSSEQTDEEVAKCISTLFEGVELNTLTEQVATLKPIMAKDCYISEEGQKAVMQFCIDGGIIKKELNYKDIVNMSAFE